MNPVNCMKGVMDKLGIARKYAAEAVELFVAQSGQLLSLLSWGVISYPSPSIASSAFMTFFRYSSIILPFPLSTICMPPWLQ